MAKRGVDWSTTEYIRDAITDAIVIIYNHMVAWLV